MAGNFEGVLANIPGLAGYLAAEQNNQVRQFGQLQQLATLQGIASQAAQTQQRQAALMRDEKLRGVLSSLPEDATADQVMKAARPYLNSEDLVRMMTRPVPQGQPIGPNGILMPNGQIVGARPAKPEKQSNLALLIDERDSLPEGDPRRAAYDNAIRKESETAKQISPTIINPPAPSFTEVVDPKDPTRMLRVDGKQYRGGSVGDPGVLGVSGKEPTAAKRSEKEDQGREHLESEIKSMRGYFDTLNAAGAIPSSDRGALSNLAASARSSEAGQAAGRVFGTKEQDARNNIQSSRLRLLNAIKNATGMSAQQLNSNMELQTWLKALTDPSRTYESNIEILDNIERSFLRKGAGGGGGDSNDWLERAMKANPNMTREQVITEGKRLGKIK